MTPEKELTLSFYKEISEVDARKNITLVQNIETKELFIKKKIRNCDKEVFKALQEEHFPFVPAIREIVEADGEVTIIEDYIQGKSLEKVLQERRFSPEETRDLAVKICDILQPIHEHRPAIVHRDIKPGNLLLQGEQPYLIDFDISRDYDPEERRDTELMGTKTYAAPEQFGFSQSTPRTDIYALGVLMNVMITGEPPADCPVEGRMGRIIRTCTQMDPEKRYTSVRQLKKDLQGEPLTYAPPGFRGRRPIFMVLAGLWYLLILSFVFTVDVDNANGEPAGIVESILTRVAYLVIFCGMTCYLGNYRSFLEKFPFRRSSLIPLEILRILLGSICIVFGPIVALTFIYPG